MDTDLDIHCPFCFRHVIKARHPDDYPHIGDFAMCSGCGNIGVFTDRTSRKRGIAIRKPTAAERFAIYRNARCQEFRQCWTKAKIN